MNTKIVKMSPGQLRMDDIRAAGKIIKEGGLVAFPTETVYGLGGNALDVKASHRIYAAKGRPSDNPLIVHIADMESLPALVTEIPEGAQKLADVCWPGPLTMIFQKSSIVPYETTGGLDSVAVRMPDHPIARALIREAGGYVAAPSANTSGRPSPTLAGHVIEDLSGKIEMIIDGGSVGIGLESTIVDFTEDIPTILRPGYINEQMLRDILGEVRMDQGLIAEDSGVHPKAPGMKYRHYAPKGTLFIVEGMPEKVAARIEELAEEKIAEGYTVGIIGTDESVGRYTRGIIKSIGARSDEESIGRHLYSVLREFDECNASYIFSESFDTPKMGQAIMNRLLKAAGHQVIKV
ncbi:MAG: L-threonylcarbamoyladenylate synthase [Ruminococcus sp.]|jgi:L-threonylcarbamoyladenylate synthase